MINSIQRIKHYLHDRKSKRMLPVYCRLILQKYGEHKFERSTEINGRPVAPRDYIEATYDSFDYKYRITREYGYVKLFVHKRGGGTELLVAEFQLQERLGNEWTEFHRLNLGKWTDDFMQSGWLIEHNTTAEARRDREARFAPIPKEEN